MELYIAFLPVFLIGLYIYKKDTEKEPIKLLLNLLLRGIGAAFLTVIISSLLETFTPFLNVDDITTLNVFERLFYVFISIALIEEGVKYLFLYKFTYNNKEFDTSFDMIVYSTFVSLGFALFENIIYVYDGGFHLGIYRALTAIPLHASCGIIMGAFLSIAKVYDVYKVKEVFKYKLLALITPVLVHGIYDYFAMSNNSFALIFFVPFIICVDIITINIVEQMLIEDTKLNRDVNKN